MTTCGSDGPEALVPVAPATSTTFTVPNLTAGAKYCFYVFAQNANGMSPASTPAGPVTIPTTAPPPSGGGLTLERGRLSFGAVRNGTTITVKTPAQTFMVTQTAGGAALNWTVTSSNARITVSPASGSGTKPVTVSFASTNAAVGTYDDTVTVTVGSTPLVINVRSRVYNAGTTTPAGGFFDTPTDGATNVAGAIPVTGWAVDDVAVSRVDIYRDPVSGEGPTPVFLGSGSFISGSRPDVEQLYPEYPLAYRGGWGFMVLTNMLPDLAGNKPAGGNGSFRLLAYAIDAEGGTTYLGAKRFTANNSGSNKPFGTLDTPAQGGVVSGNGYAVFGWALSKGGTIPTNGSTITVFIDGAAVGHPTYNNNRADIANLFPGYANSNGAIGFYVLNSTLLSNGTHTISWLVTDSGNNTSGIGSRFFTVQNGTSAVTANAVQSTMVASTASGDAVGQPVEAVSELPASYSAVEVKKPASDDPMPEMAFPEWSGVVNLEVRETEAVELRLANQFTDNYGGTYEGYVVVGGHMRSLPVGSTLDAARGTFKWQPGPGFVGTYEFVFIRNMSNGWKTRIPVTVKIGPKFDK